MDIGMGMSGLWPPDKQIKCHAVSSQPSRRQAGCVINLYCIWLHCRSCKHCNRGVGTRKVRNLIIPTSPSFMGWANGGEENDPSTRIRNDYPGSGAYERGDSNRLSESPPDVIASRGEKSSCSVAAPGVLCNGAQDLR